jgi:hypothetical protein
MLTAETFETFLHKPRDHQEGRHWIGPPPAGNGIGHQSQEEGEGEIRAGQRLLRLDPERRTANDLRGMEFSPRDKRHDDERGHREDDADGTLRNRFLVPEGQARLDEHVEGEREERASDKAMDPCLASLDGLGVGPSCLDTEPPEERRGRRTLDEAIKTEAHQRDTPGVEARPECYHAFEDIVSHRRADKPQTYTPPIARGERGHRCAEMGSNRRVHGLSSFELHGPNLAKLPHGAIVFQPIVFSMFLLLLL